MHTCYLYPLIYRFSMTLGLPITRKILVFQNQYLVLSEFKMRKFYFLFFFLAWCSSKQSRFVSSLQHILIPFPLSLPIQLSFTRHYPLKNKYHTAANTIHNKQFPPTIHNTNCFLSPFSHSQILMPGYECCNSKAV